MFLPYRSKNPPESLPIATVVLIVFNVLFFVLTCDGWAIRRSVLQDWGLKSSNFDFVHMNTSMFLHGDWLHLLGNMFFLYLFGFAVEGRLRTFKFLLLYFASGYAGDLLYHAVLGRLFPNVPGIGASGAIMGVVGAALWMFPHAKIPTVYYFGWWIKGAFDCPLWGVALYFLGFDLLWAVVKGTSGGGGVNHLAHLGGALGGLLAAMAFRPRRDTFEASEAKATFAETKDLGLLSSRELADLHRANPHDVHVIAHWMHRNLRDGRVTPEAQAAFRTALPRLLQEGDVRSVASSVLQTLTTGDYPVRTLLEIAGRLERAGDAPQATMLYERVYGDPRANEDDRAGCLLRVAALCEGPMRNPARAVACYDALLAAMPMGPLADTARARRARLKA